ncbi:MAG TPA: ABC transporter ATP-binding protein [Opitutaceae bacterium]|nr:ABC transporter ATP-binding protein [Opitutaceae bacterium]
MPVAEVSVQPITATGAASLGSAIELRGVSKRFPAGPVILDGVDLSVRPGEIVSLVGPSGCGKSTLLRLLAGLDREHTGTIAVGGTAIAGPSRSVGFMFQEPRLLPWLTVAQNIAFGIAPERRADSAAIVRRLLDQVHLDGSAKLYPRQLSGGMQQRVALARALAAEPSVLLLDEPFSALDAFTRIHLQDLVLELWQRTGLTMVLVTHEVDEALYLSDRVVVFSERPARIAEVIDVKLARPRDRRDPALLELRGHLLEQLRLAGRWDRRKPEYEI